MNKISIKLIYLSIFLPFIFGLSFASPALAYYVYNTNGVIFVPDNNYQNNQSNYLYTYVTNQTPQTQNQSTVNSNTSNVSSSNTNTDTTNTSNTSNTVSRNTDANSNSNNTVSSNNNETFGSLTANALIGSNSFMPSGLLQWITFIVIITLIIFLWRYVHQSEDAYMTEPMKHA